MMNLIFKILDRFFGKKENKDVTLETERLVLRPWRESDDLALFKYASHPEVGPPAGWLPHRSIFESQIYIKTLFMKPGVFAITLKGQDEPIGCIGISLGKNSNLPLKNDEGEIGYWIGYPFWGQGLMPEATREVIRYGFEDMHLSKLWCGYFDGNERSKRVQEKCGFKYNKTLKNRYWEQTDELKTEHITCLDKKEWIKNG